MVIQYKDFSFDFCKRIVPWKLALEIWNVTSVKPCDNTYASN